MKKSNPLLTAYRVLAYVTGVGLVLLTIACILKYGFSVNGAGTMVAIVGTLHGWLFIAYAIVAFSLGNKVSWPMGKMAWTILAGTVPTAVFFVERRVVRELREAVAAKDEQLVNA